MGRLSTPIHDRWGGHLGSLVGTYLLLQGGYLVLNPETQQVGRGLLTQSRKVDFQRINRRNFQFVEAGGSSEMVRRSPAVNSSFFFRYFPYLNAAYSRWAYPLFHRRFLTKFLEHYL